MSTLGGKGVNLVELRDAGFPVPVFVVLPTNEYDEFVAAAGLTAVIDDAVALDPEVASARIRDSFRAAPMTDEQRSRISAAVAPFAGRPVAVRSSATAEDLPDASFAGQQDTFLDVEGTDAILGAAIECWSSLWTPRAISYRAHNDMADAALSLAVVVQQMVQAEASGVLFTANPLTGNRGETVIDAVFGLGEALVSGQVIPDNYVVATGTDALIHRTLTTAHPTLSAAHLRTLTDLGRRIAAHFGQPQDIEWTRVGDNIQIVQSRAITNLFPVPDSPPGTDTLWFSVGAVQGMLAPLTPLGQDTLRATVSGITALAGRRIDWRDNAFVKPAGGRLWVRLDAALRTALTRRLVFTMLPVGDPGSIDIVRQLGDEPAFAVTRRAPQRSTLARVATLVRRVAARVPRTLRHPDRSRAEVTVGLLELPERVATRLRNNTTLSTPGARLRATGDVIETLGDTFFPTALPLFGPVIVPTLLGLKRLNALARRTGLPDADALAMGVLRGLPGNVTTEMDLRLADIADTIRDDAASREAFTTTDAPALARAWLEGTLPPAAQDGVTGFLADYGFRGPGEIDLGAPRWIDDPTGVCQTLIAYVGITDPARRPRAAFDRGVAEAEEGIVALVRASTPRAACQIRFFAGRIRSLFGVRETPKFAIIKALGALRTALRASGADLVEAGLLDKVDDIFFLHLDELADAFAHDHRDVVRQRKDEHARETRRRRLPRILAGDGRAFYEGIGADGDLAGMGVSPGVAEGRVRVVFDPSRASLAEGEVLVCPGTDPAWTPLFATASALITEVGGLMTHGSVVAREYGIPAVVGVHDATTRLETGQLIRVDGSSGAIEILSGAEQ